MNHLQERPLSGSQTFLKWGDYSAAIASVGASIRILRHKDRDLVVPFDADQVRPAFRGAVLAPWPNRVVDGRYSFADVEHQLSISEPDRGHALHGLLLWQDWSLKSSTSSTAVYKCLLEAQTGYPFPLHMQVTYELGADGLTTTVAAFNAGRETAPYGTSAHPFLTAGEGNVDDWTLELPADEVLQVTPERLIPTGKISVSTPEGRELDFRSRRPLESRVVDHAYTGLIRDSSGRATVSLMARNGTGTEMSWGTECPWVQIYTDDNPHTGYRQGVAVEPMTCPPDAFNSGIDLIHLAPGQTHVAEWTISAVDPRRRPLSVLE